MNTPKYPTGGDDVECVFCEIVAGRVPASIVFQDDLTIAFIDFRQFHAGHTLVIPRRHLRDVRELDEPTGAALMVTTARVTRAVAAAFPNEGLSLWHSIGEAAFQEVPHLHLHVHPRFQDDGVLRIYPHAPATPDKEKRDEYAARIRQHLDQEDLPGPTATFVPANSPRVGVGCIVVRDGQLLLVRNHRGFWSTPGGHLDFGESPEVCAARETLEETGVSVTEVEFVAVTNDVFADAGRHYVTIWMRGQADDAPLTIGDAAEIAEIGWFASEALPRPLHLYFQNLISGNCLPRSPANMPFIVPPSPDYPDTKG